MREFTPLQINNLSELFYNHQIHSALLEDWLESNIKEFCKISYDYYDHSIELYLGPYWNNISLEDKIFEMMQKCGFSLCFVNYCNSKEEVVSLYKTISRGGIRLAPNSRWSAEEAAEYV